MYTQSLAPADFTDAVFTSAQFQNILIIFGSCEFSKNSFTFAPPFNECVVLVSACKNSVKLYIIYKQLKEYPMFEKGGF